MADVHTTTTSTTAQYEDITVPLAALSFQRIDDAENDEETKTREEEDEEDEEQQRRCLEEIFDSSHARTTIASDASITLDLEIRSVPPTENDGDLGESMPSLISWCQDSFVSQSSNGGMSHGSSVSSFLSTDLTSIGTVNTISTYHTISNSAHGAAAATTTTSSSSSSSSSKQHTTTNSPKPPPRRGVRSIISCKNYKPDIVTRREGRWQSELPRENLQPISKNRKRIH